MSDEALKDEASSVPLTFYLFRRPTFILDDDSSAFESATEIPIDAPERLEYEDR
jgi:hypothetical protein